MSSLRAAVNRGTARLLLAQGRRLFEQATSIVTVLYLTVNLLGVAMLDARAFRRLVVLLGMIGVLLALGCALGITWRAHWPQLPELNIPTTVF
jgi:hypothetical protein